jgi:hypothetical protein
MIRGDKHIAQIGRSDTRRQGGYRRGGGRDDDVLVASGPLDDRR